MPMSAPYEPAKGCDARLTEYCNKYCPHYEAYGPLFARYDASDNSPALAWRCYARHTLSQDLQRYESGTDYCTRQGPLLRELEFCTRQYDQDIVHAAVDAASGGTQELPPPPPPPPPKPKPLPPMPGRPPPGTEPWIRIPRYRLATKSPPPQYSHEAALLELPPGLVIPRADECDATLLKDATFWAASLYTKSYAFKSDRLHESCDKWKVCCRTALMPDGVIEGETEGSKRLRHRLIALKPLFILRTLEASSLPLAWMDVDLEFHSYPILFTPGGWPSPEFDQRDVMLWNWQVSVSSFQHPAPTPHTAHGACMHVHTQGNVSHFNGRRLKTASGIAWFNKTESASLLLTAWAQSMAYDTNIAAPDDQALDLLVNDDGWIDRCNFGWLPASYLRMMPRFAYVTPVIDHDRGMPVSGAGKNSMVVPKLPPHA